LTGQGSAIESQLPAAASYSHWRPFAVAHGRQLPGELKTIAPTLERPGIMKIFAHLGAGAA
jgi:hypothetical protein